MKRILPRWGVIVAAIVTAPVVHADGGTDPLFQEGVRLFKVGQIDAACQKFEASYAADQAPGTLFNLAACHEKQGKLVAARREFLVLAAQADAAGKGDKAAVARDKAQAVEAKLPRVELTFAAESNAATITVDGTPLGAGDFHAPIFLAPGTHEIAFAAPDKVSESRKVEVPDTPGAVKVLVPGLAAERTKAREPDPSPPTSSTQDEPRPGKPVLGYVLLGTGGVAAAVGVVFGFQATSQKSDAEAACGSSSRACPDAAHAAAAQSSLDSARSSALLSTALVGGGIVVAGIGAFLILRPRAPAQRDAARRIGVTFAPSSGGGTTSLRGEF